MKTLFTVIIIVFLTSGIRSQSRDTIYQTDYWQIISLDSTEINSVPYIRWVEKNETTKDSSVYLLSLTEGIKVQEQLDSLIELYTTQYYSIESIREYYYLQYRKTNNKAMRLIQLINGLIAIKEE
jgi:hypothetical protein